MKTRGSIEAKIDYLKGMRHRAAESDYPELYWNGDEAEKLALLEWVLED